MINFIVGGAALYGLAVGGLYFLQDGMLFPRAAASFPSYPLPAEAQPLALTTPDGVSLHGHLVPAREKSRGLLLSFPGNAWNGEDFTVFLAHRIRDFDIVVFHYRGYAPSEGRPSETALTEDALLIHDHLVERLQPEAVYAAGFSLGSGVASHLASRRELDGLLLVTPFDSIEAVARQRYPWAPVSALLKHPFHSARHLAGRDVPAAIIMASNDRVIPKERSEALVRALARPVLVETVPDSSHNGIYDQERFDEVLLEALEAVESAATSRQKAPEAALIEAPA